MTLWSYRERVRAALDGRAMPDGSLPVDDLPSLLAAVQSLPRLDETRQLDGMSHLLRRARELQVSPDLVRRTAEVFGGAELIAAVQGRAAVGSTVRHGDREYRVSSLTASGIRVWDDGQLIELSEAELKAV